MSALLSFLAAPVFYKQVLFSLEQRCLPILCFCFHSFRLARTQTHTVRLKAFLFKVLSFKCFFKRMYSWFLHVMERKGEFFACVHIQNFHAVRCYEVVSVHNPCGYSAPLDVCKLRLRVAVNHGEEHVVDDVLLRVVAVPHAGVNEQLLRNIAHGIDAALSHEEDAVERCNFYNFGTSADACAKVALVIVAKRCITLSHFLHVNSIELLHLSMAHQFFRLELSKHSVKVADGVCGEVL